MVPAQVSYAIGVAQPLSVHVDTYGTGTIPDADILEAILKNFDFRPGMRLPILQLTQIDYNSWPGPACCWCVGEAQVCLCGRCPSNLLAGK